jgi:L-threonylcarbamoyladenylate synthase
VSDEQAVQGIFTAKGRPANVPIIIHALDVHQAQSFVKEMGQREKQWAREHWPGPLTLVLHRSTKTPDVVSAGGPSVAVRVPDHPVALALIEALGEAIAAPSANPYDRLPPVRAEHVMKGLNGRIHAVLDGGKCPGGLESTVVDARQSPAAVLRRGALSLDKLGHDLRDDTVRLPLSLEGWIRVGEEARFKDWFEVVRGKVGRMGWGAVAKGVEFCAMPSTAHEYAETMYDNLHELWDKGCSRVWVDVPPKDSSWDSVWDRLARLTSIPPP